MDRLKRNATFWFRTSAVVGLPVALISVGVAIATYRFVAGHLAVDHLNREAGRYAAILEYRAQDEAATRAELTDLLQSVRQEDASQVDWIRILGRNREMLAETSGGEPTVFDEADLEQVLDMRRRSIIKRLPSADGDILVAVLPFRYQLRSEVADRASGKGSGRERRFKLIEVALYLHGAGDAFASLRRNLLVGILAPLALLVAIGFLLWRFPAYLRGRELEHQVALAHRVQQALLPAENPDSGELEVTAEFRPYWGVGGDYFDVFTLDGSRTFIVLGDVSGKGLPAALIMGLLHGAVRSTAQAWTGSNHDVLAGELNRLLHENTASNRFVTFFWACFEPRECRLRLINAGHKPPVVVRGSTGRYDPTHRQGAGRSCGTLGRPFERTETK